MTPREKIDRAKQMLDDPLVRHVFDDIRQELVTKLETAPLVDDTGIAHETALSLQLLKRFREKLVQYAQQDEIDKHRAKQDSFIARARQKIFP